jgi:hypothetical protein
MTLVVSTSHLLYFDAFILVHVVLYVERVYLVLFSAPSLSFHSNDLVLMNCRHVTVVSPQTDQSYR